MRNLRKLECPQVLIDNAMRWLEEYISCPSNETNRFRYRSRKIKETLREETSNKCIYCESKLGHNTPGDIEHIQPMANVRNRSSNGRSIFEWSNLTLPCTSVSHFRIGLLTRSPVATSCLMVLIRASRRAVGPLTPVDCRRCAEERGGAAELSDADRANGGEPAGEGVDQVACHTPEVAYGVRVPVSAGRSRVCNTVSTSSSIEKSGSSRS